MQFEHLRPHQEYVRRLWRRSAYGNLINCTVTGNTNGNGRSTGNGGGAAYANLVNCIVYANRDVLFGNFNFSASNHYSCTFSSSCSSPLPAGTGNIGADPQLLGDGIHLTATSPCRGAGTNTVASGTDIDGQPWANPPPMGCDEWSPAPVIGLQPARVFTAKPDSIGIGVVGRRATAVHLLVEQGRQPAE